MCQLNFNPTILATFTTTPPLHFVACVPTPKRRQALPTDQSTAMHFMNLDALILQTQISLLINSLNFFFTCPKSPRFSLNIYMYSLHLLCNLKVLRRKLLLK